jgi:daunorubicin resistance ABC transporter membrane protein
MREQILTITKSASANASAPEEATTEVNITEGTALPMRALRYDLALLGTLWRREMLHLIHERSRWLGIIIQPLLFWIIIGSGLTHAFKLTGANAVSYATYFYPGTLVMMVLFTSIFATISVIEDRQSGFLQAVLVAPGARYAMVCGKILGVTTLTLIQSAVYLLAAPWAGFPFSHVGWGALLLALTLACIGLTAVNFAMAWLLRSSQSYHALMSLILMPLWVVSGAMFPVPEHSWLALVMQANPLTYVVASVHSALAGAQASLVTIGLSQSLFLSGLFAVVMLAFAIAVSRRGNGATR